MNPHPDLPLAYESPFERALAEESRWLCVVVERPMPDDALAGHRCYVGPTLLPRGRLLWDGVRAS